MSLLGCYGSEERLICVCKRCDAVNLELVCDGIKVDADGWKSVDQSYSPCDILKKRSTLDLPMIEVK